MTPLTVYSLPCNESSPSLKTGFGQCPTTLTMSIPIFARRVVKYIPWIVPANQTTLNLHYNSLKIGPRLRFNKSTIKALDETFARLEGPLNRKFKTIRDEISSIKETSATSTACNRLCSLSHHRPKYSCVDHHRLLYTTFAPQQAICYSWHSQIHTRSRKHRIKSMLYKMPNTIGFKRRLTTNQDQD